MSEILIRVKTEKDIYDEYDVTIVHEQVTVEQLMEEQSEYSLKSRGYIKIDPKTGKVSRETVELLRKYGWAHIETAKDREERKALEQELFLLDETVAYSYREPKFAKIDPDNLTDDQLRQLAKSAKIVQCVSAKSVLSESQYKRLQTKKKQLEDMRERAKKSAEKKAATKKEREIARAKKLLEEAGVK